MEVSFRKSINCSRAERRLRILQYRTTPYFIIVLFSLTIACARAFIMPQYGVWIHMLMFVMQLCSLVGIWQLVKFINGVLDRTIPFEQGPLARVLLQIAITMLIIGPVMIMMAMLMKPYLPPFVNRQFIAIGVILFIVMIVLFNFGFYAYYFFANWQRSIETNAKLEVQAAELEREKFNLQYHQLKNQVNPHYLFNTLTSLDGLIHTDPELASEFVRHMAKVYRYVLQHKENEVVSLEEELDFISHYIQLLHIRYDGALFISHEISAEARDKGVVMVTLQMLIDNAVKHNIVQHNSPLKILITCDSGYLCVCNNKQLRRQIESSNGHGILQLKQLYSFLTEKPILIEDKEAEYIIKIPLL